MYTAEPRPQFPGDYPQGGGGRAVRSVARPIAYHLSGPPTPGRACRSVARMSEDFESANGTGLRLRLYAARCAAIHIARNQASEAGCVTAGETGVTLIGSGFAGALALGNAASPALGHEMKRTFVVFPCCAATSRDFA